MSGLVKQKLEIQEQDYHNNQCNVVDFVCSIAGKTGFSAEGYGVYNAELVEENGRYYAVWDRLKSCD